MTAMVKADAKNVSYCGFDRGNWAEGGVAYLKHIEMHVLFDKGENPFFERHDLSYVRW